MSDPLTHLLSSGPIITDGAWGTQMQQRGLKPGACPDLWNLSHPEHVEAVAKSYVDAGSQIILTNTFGANNITLASHQAADQVAEINRRGAAISLTAAADKALVFASIGPSGKMLMMEDVTEEELTAAFTEQAAALKEGGVHGLVIETMTDIVEASIAARAALATGLPVVVCMAFDSGAENDRRTMMGVTPAQAAKELSALGVTALGANCGLTVDEYLPICQQLRSATDLPIWLKPNAGVPTVEEGNTVYAAAPDAFATAALALGAKGASFIGGCCGTSPAFISAIARQKPAH